MPKYSIAFVACTLLIGAPVQGQAPVGSAFLREMRLEAPPFGWKLEDQYPYDGVRMQRWRRPRPEADWLVVWIDLQTPGLGMQISDVHLAPGPGGDLVQSAEGHNIRDFMEAHPDVQLSVNTVAYFPFPATKGKLLHLSEPIWKGSDNQHEPRAGTWMLGLSPGKAVVGEANDVRSAQPQFAFGSFYDVFAETPDQSILLRHGKMQSKPVKPHARTLAGIRDNGRVLILVIADGYNPTVSVGLTHADGAEILKAAGATEGIVLDGGGSSALACRQEDGSIVIVNRPAGQFNVPGTLRYVAAHVGFTGLRRTAEPLPGWTGVKRTEEPPTMTEWEANPLLTAYCRIGVWARVNPWRATILGVAVCGVLVGSGFWLRRPRRVLT